MVQLTDAERELVDDLLKCIAEAMYRLDDVDPSYANKTKLQKLLYLAIDEFDLPITYSWYLAGAVLPGDHATLTDLESAFNDLPNTETPSTPMEDDTTTDEDTTSNSNINGTANASAEEQFDVTDVDTEIEDETRDPVSDETSATPENSSIDPILFTGSESYDVADPAEPTTALGKRRADVVDFYVSVIPEVWRQNTMRFLQNFYLEHAPSTYRNLYVQSTHLRTRLRDIEMAIDDRLHGTQPGQVISELVKAAELDISDIHCTIHSSETLSTTFDSFVRGTDLIEDGLMMVDQRAPEDLEHDHLSAIRSMQEFFYYYVWRYPCLIISQETAMGPSAESLRTSRQRRIEDFDAEIAREADRFERELADAELKPTYMDYPSENNELEQTVSALADHYLK